jgi:hypothetical protein
MSMTPPAGWYADPSVPSTERWWDGTAWTEHRRPAAPAGGQGPAQPAGGFGPAQPQPPGFGPVQPGGFGPPQPGYVIPGPRRGRAVALTAAAVVAVAAVVTSVVLASGGDDSDAGPSPTTHPPTVTTSAPTATDSPSSQATSAPIVDDDIDGLSFPVTKGWEKAQYSVDDSVLLSTPGTYDCPGEGSLCLHGVVASAPVTGTDSTDPKTVARQDITTAASHFFDKDDTGSKPYGGLVSHHRIKEGAVRVVGRAGYMVRWKVTTKAGPGGYVESLVFPSNSGGGQLVCVRFAFDASRSGPPLSDMDKIAKGIRVAGGGGGG